MPSFPNSICKCGNSTGSAFGKTCKQCKLIKELKDKIYKYELALTFIVNGGDFLKELEQTQDSTFPSMPLAYSKDCYRIAKNTLKLTKE